VEIYRRKNMEVRRLDVIFLVIGVSIWLYYYALYGWQTAVLGVAMYILVLMVALWMF
jgi:glucose-6-phosphate-specific signal transduction histidine kinase